MSRRRRRNGLKRVGKRKMRRRQKEGEEKGGITYSEVGTQQIC